MLIFLWGKPHESQSTGSSTNEFLLDLLRFEIIGAGCPPDSSDVRH